MAEAIFRDKVKKENLQHIISTDSAGTGNWHIGNSPHEGTLDILGEHQINCENIIARQVEEKDLQDFNYIIAMDASNLGNLHRLKGFKESGEVFRLLDLMNDLSIEDVPDPYFTGNFVEVYDLVDKGCEKLLSYIKKKESLSI